MNNVDRNTFNYMNIKCNELFEIEIMILIRIINELFLLVLECNKILKSGDVWGCLSPSDV